MFLNYKVLEERLKSTMHKYGIRDMDYEVMFMINDAMKHKYTDIIKDLIQISRSSQSNAYLTHKNSMPREIVEVNAFNLINKDKNKSMTIGNQVKPEDTPKTLPNFVTSFDLICTSNN